MISQEDKKYLIKVLSGYIAGQENPRSTLTSPFTGDSGFQQTLPTGSPQFLVNQAVNLCIQNGWQNNPPWLLVLLNCFPTGIDAQIDRIRDNLPLTKPVGLVDKDPVFNSANSSFDLEIETLDKLIDSERSSNKWFWIVSVSSLLFGLGLSVYFYVLPNSYQTSRSEQLEIIRLIITPVPCFVGVCFWMFTRDRYTKGEKYILGFEHLKELFETGNVNEETQQIFNELMNKLRAQNVT